MKQSISTTCRALSRHAPNKQVQWTAQRPASVLRRCGLESRNRICILLAFVVVALSNPEPGYANPSESMNDRKERSEAQLIALGVPVNKWLPAIDSDAQAVIRKPDEVAKRAIVLFNLVAVGYGVARSEAVQVLKNHGLWASVSASEREFFENESPPHQEVVNATWRVEALWVLLWSLGLIESLELPTDLCDVQVVQATIPKMSEIQDFVASASLRSKSEILDEADFIYRVHWATRDASIKGEKIPGNFNNSVVIERHYALNWLTLYAEEWDEITTDT